MIILDLAAVGALVVGVVYYLVSMFTHARSDIVLKAERILLGVFTLVFMVMGVVFLLSGAVIGVVTSAIGCAVSAFCVGYQTVWLRGSNYDD